MSDRGRSPSRHAGSVAPSRASSRRDSPARSAAAGPAGNWPKGPGFDPAKPAQKEGNTRVELPADAYISDTQKDFFTLRGNRKNTDGKPEMIEVNQYRMTKFDFSKKIFQYDVSLEPEPKKFGPVLKKVLSHPKFKDALKKYNGNLWLFDGKKLAWAPKRVEGGQIEVRLDLDEGQQSQKPPTDKPQKPQEGALFKVKLRNTTEIQVSALKGYLNHQTSFNNSVQEALNFLDHLVRQYPSEHMLAIKRNFYRQSDAGIPLMDGNVVEVHKGSYASIRMSDNMARGGVGLGYNIDVANTCFWIGGQTVDALVKHFLATCDFRWKNLRDNTDLQKELRPVRRKDGGFDQSDAFKQLRKLRRLKFTVRHTNRRNDKTVYSIEDFLFEQAAGPEGVHARNRTFDVDGKKTSVFDYYQSKYKVTLRGSYLPLIKTAKGEIPMEIAWVEPMQRYPFKLNPDQTAAMIKIAVTRPNVRKADIQRNVKDLQIGSDPYLREYGVAFEPQFAKTEARILPAPPVKFSGNGKCEPGVSGRWDLRGKKFWKRHVAPLTSWGFVILEREMPLPALQQFAATFKTTFIGHGGVCNKDPEVMMPPPDMRTNAAATLNWAFERLLKSKGYPQLIFCVVSKRNTGTYERLKKSADCRFGILTQVILQQHMMKNNGQYHSNVCMKVNAKLGGSTACTPPLWGGQTYFPANRPTMIVGVDVSHAAPGGNTPSMAAMTMSMDPDATKYASLVETNGYRTEMLTPANIDKLFGGLASLWKQNFPNGNPQHVIYFRDGVGEGQFAKVLIEEVALMKKWLSTRIKGPAPKFTVIIATKRHHIRFFPQRGDRNGNPLPGTLVEKEVTHPFMWDFYLASHVAIQGTARPVHYHVLLDEANMPCNDLQKMIYQQCYSYARSTTPVSLHPAVYYAHLASNRARAHENVATSEGFRAGPKGHEMVRDKIAKGKVVSDTPADNASPPLLPLGGAPAPTADQAEKNQRAFFKRTMWYI